MAGSLRASILVLGPLVAHFGYAKLSLPGGCTIGARPVEEHVRGLEILGACVDVVDGCIEARASKLRGGLVNLVTPSVTGTMNILMVACLARGVTRIHNAAREPEIADLVNLLVSMEAEISGAGTSVLTIVGRDKLLSPGGYKVMEDRIEAGTFLILGAICGNPLMVHRCNSENQTALIKKLREAGALVEILGNSVTVRKAERPLPVDIQTGPYPDFPTDLQPQFTVLLSLAEGQSRVTKTIFENRFGHCPGLRAMGTEIHITGQTAVISGGPRLSAALVAGSGLRAAASLVLAAIAAHGTSVVGGMRSVNRVILSLRTSWSGLELFCADCQAIKKLSRKYEVSAHFMFVDTQLVCAFLPILCLTSTLANILFRLQSASLVKLMRMKIGHS